VSPVTARLLGEIEGGVGRGEQVGELAVGVIERGDTD
jgi:hypothetical protein